MTQNDGATAPGIDDVLRRLGIEPGSEEAFRLTRRGVLGALGGLTALALAGCNKSGVAGGVLPNPVWGENGDGPAPPRPAPTASAPAPNTNVSIPSGVIPS